MYSRSQSDTEMYHGKRFGDAVQTATDIPCSVPFQIVEHDHPVLAA